MIIYGKWYDYTEQVNYDNYTHIIYNGQVLIKQ